MTRALNIKIQDAIYSQLDHHAKTHNLTKTQIVEKALSQWFSGSVDADADNVDTSIDINVENIKQLIADEVARATKHLTDKINQLESTISKMSEENQATTDKQETIDGRLELVEDNQSDFADREQFLEGLSCSLPVPIESDIDPIADDSSEVDDNVDNDVELHSLLSTKQLSDRLGISEKEIRSHAKYSSPIHGAVIGGGKMISEKWQVQSKSPLRFIRLGTIDSNIDTDIDNVEDETMTQPNDSNWEPLMTLDEVEAKYGNKPELPQPLTQSQLADRLGCHPKSISNNLKKGTATKANKFCEKKEDYYWRWSEQDGKFYPQTKPF